MREIFNNILYMARRFKTVTAFNMVGLIVSFATFYLLMTQIAYQVTYNHGLKDYERIYRMETDFVFNEWEFSDAACRPLADALNKLPQVETHSLVVDVGTGNYTGYYTYTFKRGDREMEYVVTYGNNTVVKALNDSAVSGSIEWTDSDRVGCIIPLSIAMDYFGRADAAGDTMTYVSQEDGRERKKVVRGVYQDYPENCELKNYIYDNIFDEGLASLNFAYKCFVKFKEVPSDMNAFAGEVKRSCISNLTGELGDWHDSRELRQKVQAIEGTRIRFVPLADSYFESSSFTSGDNGYWGMLRILELACLMVVLIAIINYLNFMLAESPVRMRSLNTRQVLGASRCSLRLGLIGECVVTSLVACVVALALCWALSRVVPSGLLIVGGIALGDHRLLVLLILGVSVAAGALAGLYPALFATSFPPAVALKARFGLTPQGRQLRTMLVCLQLVISMLLLIYIGILYMQSRHIYNAPYGYNKERILVAELPVTSSDTVVERLSSDLLHLPGIERVSFSDARLGTTDGHNTVHTEAQGHAIRYSHMFADTSFVKTMGITMLEGRDFAATDSTAIIVNQSTLSKWNWVKLGTKISIGFDEESGDSAVVVGVCEDIHYGTMRIHNDQPFFIILDQDLPGYNLNIRMTADAQRLAVRQQAYQLLRKYYGHKTPDLQFFDDTLEQAYKGEFRFFQLIYYLCIICIVITLIGVACLTMFETEYRRMEIGIRKAAGATTGEIVKMFARRYGWLILISFAIAAPVAWKCGDVTLDYFSDRAPISWWLFPLALLVVGGVTLVTVAMQTWRVARENPTLNLKNSE